MMSMGFRHRQELRQEISLRQLQEQRLSHKISLRLEMIRAFRGERYKVKAACPNCGYLLSVAQVIKGFNRDPQDTTTKCPRCKQRFSAHLYQSNSYVSMTLVFLCPVQTLEQLKGLSDLRPDQIKEKHLTAYTSAIFHFGNLTEAFKQLKVNYRKKEQIDWKQKIVRYLGQTSDVEIARCAGISVSTIRRLRRKLKIGRFWPD